MATPHDRQRIDAFRAWISHIGGIDSAARFTGIARRTIERMNAGRQPPPVRLLETLADDVALAAPGLADRLARAAQPAEGAQNA